MTVAGIDMPHAKMGDGPKTLVILPGLSVKQVTPIAIAVKARYQEFIDAGYTIHLFDRRTNAPAGYSVEDMARDTAAHLRSLGVERADVFGASQGGMMALYLAADYPELVDHLMTCSSCARVNATLGRVCEEWIGLARDRNEAALIESFGRFVCSEARWEASKNLLRTANANITDEEYARFITMASAELDYDCRGRLGDIEAKCLVLGSRGDRVVTPEGSEELARLLGCECHLYDETFGHGVYDEAPDFVTRLLEFCQR